MKKNEIIKLNDKEYTLELNRRSATQIEKYTHLQEKLQEISKPTIDYVDEISIDEDPFAEENLVDDEEVERKQERKFELMCQIIETAFWIWLFPNHRLSIDQVREILQPYFDDDKKFEYISSEYGKYMKMSSEVKFDYIEEQKNLKAQANK